MQMGVLPGGGAEDGEGQSQAAACPRRSPLMKRLSFIESVAPWDALERTVAWERYSREVGFNPLDSLRERDAPGRLVAWLEHCCSAGKAPIEAAGLVHADGTAIEIVGVDLVGMFHRPDSALTCLRPRSPPGTTSHFIDPCPTNSARTLSESSGAKVSIRSSPDRPSTSRNV
jgi:hypothetical protein